MNTQRNLNFSNKDLRIGNLLESENLGICRVIGLRNNSVWVSANYGDEHKVEFSSLKRIKITANWLKAFDFTCVQEIDETIVADEENGEVIDLYELPVIAPIHRRDICFFVRMNNRVSWTGEIMRETVSSMFYTDTYETFLPYLASKYYINDLQNFYYYTIGFEIKIKQPQWVK